MYSRLKTIAEANNMKFEYARRDFQNLEEIDVNKVHLFLDPVTINENHGDYNRVESRDYSGRFLLLVSSEFNQDDYEGRYLENIKPLIDTSIETVRDGLRCDGKMTINTWSTTEVINLFDQNYDGLVVTYSVNEDA
ncbi:MAG: hypothetical protein AAGC43_04685 [Bacteroidota bacterium]